MTNLSASDIAALRIREARKRRGLTVKQLAAACEKAGATHLTAPVITNLETRRRPGRQVTAEELLALALVLEVPPLQLIAPLSADEALEVTPGNVKDVLEAAGWLTDDDLAVVPVWLSRSPRAEDTERVLRDTSTALTVIRQIRTITRQIGVHFRALTGEAPYVSGTKTFHKNSIAELGLRLLRLVAALETLGHTPPPLDAARQVMTRLGLPPTLADLEKNDDFGPGWEDF